MSLFPAYKPSTSDAEESNIHSLDDGNKQTDLSWLNNTSYSAEGLGNNQQTQKLPVPENESNTDSIKSKRKKKKKGVKKEKSLRYKKKTLSVPLLEDYKNEHFYEDRKQEKGNFLVDTLYRPAIPRYDKYSYYFKVYKLLKKKIKKHKKAKRYFVMPSSKKEATVDSNDESRLKEEDLTKITEDFNKRLADNPNDVDTWLEYARFQDTMFEFERTYCNNPIGGQRVTTERKLAILERALQNNPACERLVEERLELVERVWPADQVADECERNLVQDPSNAMLWRALVRTSRNTMARCVVPAVLQIFSRAISRLGQLRMLRLSHTIENDLLYLFVESGLFLQQAGLWEQLSLLVQLYLSLSLTASGQFSMPAQHGKGKLREQEDRVVASGLPLSELWLRVEKLRAAYHFLPIGDCASDPQRVVFSDDLADLLQPVMSSETQLQLVASVFVLFKVPVLPTRHTTLEHLGLTRIPSAINDSETLLAAAYPNGFSALCHCRYLSGCVDLISEPQFMKEGPGQPEFYSSVMATMQQCALLIPITDGVYIHVWTLRLYGLLCRLHTLQLVSVPPSIVKEARSHAKKLLKIPQFRENIFLYTEYAMMEKDAGDLDRACKVLETAAALPHPPLTQGEPDLHRTYLSRRLVECLLMKDYTANKELAVKILISLLDQQPVRPEPMNQATMKNYVSTWKHQTTILLEQLRSHLSRRLTITATLSPQLLVEWLTCHALFLFLTHSVWDASALLQEYIDSTSWKPNSMGSLWVEQLYEVLTGVLYLHTEHSRTGFAVLRSTLVKALKSFPNNLTLLNTLACIETASGGGGSSMWKLISYFPASAPLARLVLIFVVRYRISQHNTEETTISTTGRNYLRNLLRQLTKEKVTSECPLVWRLYLQLVGATDSSTNIKSTFYKCLQACPWVKALYLDAVKFLPEELSEVQDLLIEKELRLHTTPEELEILRD